MKAFFKIIILLITSLTFVMYASALTNGDLQVTSISSVQTSAISNNKFENGWQWIFNITVPTNETAVNMKFSDWVSGTSTISTSNNVRVYSPQAINSNSTSTAKILTASNSYSDNLILNPDMDLSPSTVGRQIQIVVEVKVPEGYNGGSYSASYGVRSNVNPDQTPASITYTINQDYASNSRPIIGNNYAQDRTLGEIILDVKNEDVKLNTLSINPQLNGVSSSTFSLLNLKIFVNDIQFDHTINIWNTDSNNQSIIFNAEEDVILKVGVNKIKIVSVVALDNYFNFSTSTFIINLNPLQNNLQGIITNRLLSLSNSSLILGSINLLPQQATPIVFGVPSNFITQAINQNTNNVKIGSFTLQASNADSLRVTNLNVALSGSVPLTSITNLTVKDGSAVIGTPVGNVSATNNFSTNITLPMSGAKTFDVYADIGSAANNTTVQAGMTATYNGVTNANTLTSTSSGVVITIGNPTINSPTISSRIASQYVLGGTNKQVIVYNFTSTYGSATLNDASFTIAGNGVQSLTMNGVTANVVGSTATFYGVNLAIPSGNQGVNVPLTVNFTPAYVGSGNGVVSGTTNTVTLTGGKVTDVSGNVTTPTYSLAANTMTLVSTLPYVNAVANSGTNVGVGTTNNVKLGTVTVRADAAGDIVVGTLAYSVAGPGTVTVSSVKVNGSTAQDKLGVDGATSTTGVTFTNGYRITAGTSVSFDIYGSVNNTGTVNGMTSVSLGANSAFTWSDDVSSNGSTRNGTLLPSTNYNN